MSKSNICLTTYFDKDFEEMGNLCLKSMKKYAKKFNLNIKLMNQIKSNRPAPWNKILIVKELLKSYEYVFWLDADAIFVRFDKDIRDEIEDGKDFYLAKVKIRGEEIPNSGVFLIKNTEWSKKFLQDVWNKKEYIYHNYWENAGVIDVLGYKDVIVYNKYKLLISEILYKLKLKRFVTKILSLMKINEYVSNLFNKQTKTNENNTKKTENIKKHRDLFKEIKWLDLKWNNLPNLQESKNSIINHYPAMPYKERLKNMRDDLKNAGFKI